MKKIGSWYLPRGEEHLLKYIERDGSYQKKERKHALSFCKQKRLALDIGAHVGLWARDLCQVFDRVVCFEPINSHVECLQANLKMFENFEIHNIALSDSKGELGFFYDAKSTGATCVESKQGAGVVSAQAVPLDLYPFDFVDFIKIDCEGWEEKILLGGRETILKHRPVINIEQKQRKPGSCYVGADTEPFGAVRLLQSWGAVLLGSVKSEFVFGWAGHDRRK
jgi:FkbM family methyltransferase